MPRLTIQRMMIGIAVLGFVLGLGLIFVRSGQIIEELNDPQRVLGWNSTGLILADGRTIPLLGIRELPPDSDVLSAAIDRGVEIAADGRVTGLLPCRHWCGNDRIKHHIARVDVADLLIFLKVVEFPLSPEIDQAEWHARRKPLDRWDPGNFGEFRIFREWLAREHSKELAWSSAGRNQE